MRISTNMIFDQSMSAMQRQSAALLYIGQQIATGRKILTPADDPVASARALDVTQSRSVNAQFTTNQGAAQDALRLVEGQLTGAGDILQYMRVRALEAGNASLSDSEVQFIAADLRTQFDAMLALANTRDANGDYLFAGYRSADRPFNGTVDGGITYAGDQGSRTMQVSSSRFMPTSFAGEDVFGDSGNSMFDTLATFIQALEGPEAGRAAAITAAVEGIDEGLDNVLRVRAQIGSQLLEVDQLVSIGGDLDVQYADTLSRLQDLDYNEAISRLTQQQTNLQAAQQSFMKITGLSLFNYLS